jgi:hypothetical protein
MSLLVEFSETTLGRFLQAVELYILLLFVLIFTFFKQPSHSILLDLPTQEPKKPEYADKSFRGLTDWQSRQSVFQITPPTILTPDEVSVDNHDPIQIQPRRLSRRSSSRLSDQGSKLNTWKFKKPGARRTSRMNTPEPLRVVNVDDPERGYSMEKGREVSLNSTEEPGTALPYLSVEAPTPEPKAILKSQWTSNTTNQIPSTSKPTKRFVDPQVQDESANGVLRPYEASSIMTYYGTTQDLSPRSIQPSSGGLPADEPVYSLDGIQPPSPATIRPQRPRSSVVSFNELMRQQKELDQSIAALRLLSPGDTSLFPLSDGVSAGKNVEPAEASRASRSRSVATISASGRSDFSLSVFPEPPEEQTEGFTSAALAALKQSRSEPVRIAENGELRPPPSNMLASYNDVRRKEVPLNVGSMDLAIPSGVRVDSAGTQYDVTSFIGGGSFN